MSTSAAATETQVGHCKRDETDVYIGRADGGRSLVGTPVGKRGWLGNPFPVDDNGRDWAIERFRRVFRWRLAADPAFRVAVRNLHGKTLGCWCQSLAEDGPACHGEVIATYADKLAMGEYDDAAVGPGANMERLFVAVNSEPYREFEAGRKDVEIRGVNDQFNPETVVTGRPVEIRRGYSTNDSLYGRVGGVWVFEDLPVLARTMDYERIVPESSRAEFFASVGETLGAYSEYIAFGVVF